MIYILLIVGISLMIVGWRQIKKEKLENKGLFKEIMVQEKEDNSEYVKLQSLMYDIKNQISSMEDKLDRAAAPEKKEIKNELLEEVDELEEIASQEDKQLISSDYNKKLNEIEKMIQENKTIEEMALDLHLGKGEVLLLKNLLKK